LIKEGDMIHIDIVNHVLEVNLSDEVLSERRKEWKPRISKITSGYLQRYAYLVTSANTGAVLKVNEE